jgi:TP901 family phage tail tape measure protein
MADLTSRLILSLVDRVTAPARAVASAFGEVGASAARLQKVTGIAAFTRGVDAALERSRARLAAYQAGILGIWATGLSLTHAFRAPAEAAADWETRLLDIGQKAGLARDQQVALGEELRKLAPALRQTSSALAGGFDFLVGMGLDPDRAMELIAPIGKAATAYRAEIEDLSKAGYAALDNLKVPATDFMLALDAMARSGKEGAFELKDMAKEFPALTASAQRLGVTGVAGVADLAAALQVARKGAADGSIAANNMANFLQKITMKETIKNFKKFGVDVPKELKKAEKAGVSPVEHMLTVLGRLTDAGKDSEKVSALFGDKQVLEFLAPLLANMDLYREIRAKSLAARGEVEKDFADRIQTAAATFAAFRVAAENAAISIGNALLPAITEATAWIGRLTEAVDRFARVHPALVSNVALAVGGLLAFRVAAFAAGFAATSLQMAALVASLGVARIGQVATITAAVGFVPLRNAAVGLAGVMQIVALRFRMGAAALAAGGGVMAFLGGGFATLARAAVGVAGVFVRLLGSIATLSGAGAIAVAIVLSISAAFVWLWNNLRGIGSFLAAFGAGFAAALGPAEGLIDPIVTAAGRLYDTVASWLGPIDESGKRWEAWGRAAGEAVAGWVNAAATLVSDTIDAIAALPGKVAALATQMYEAGAALVTSLWEGLKAEIDAMIGWFSAKIAELSAKASSLAHSLSFGLVGSAPASTSAPGPAPAAPPIDGARAGGGPVSGRRTYLVGEHGPELFTPASAGFVSPNDVFRRPAAAASDRPSHSVSIGGISISLGMMAEGRSIESIADELGRRVRSALDATFADGTV